MYCNTVYIYSRLSVLQHASLALLVSIDFTHDLGSRMLYSLVQAPAADGFFFAFYSTTWPLPELNFR